MSDHPNVILMVQLVPDDLVRKTCREITAEFKKLDADDGYITIADKDYNIEVMEEEYNDNWQIAAQIGSIVVFDLVTYGYGEKISWTKLENMKVELENWAKIVCEKYHCNYEIFVSANHW
jgi:hypothetical protein